MPSTRTPIAGPNRNEGKPTTTRDSETRTCSPRRNLTRRSVRKARYFRSRLPSADYQRQRDEYVYIVLHFGSVFFPPFPYSQPPHFPIHIPLLYFSTTVSILNELESALLGSPESALLHFSTDTRLFFATIHFISTTYYYIFFYS
jgi:hypothetical protein